MRGSSKKASAGGYMRLEKTACVKLGGKAYILASTAIRLTS